MRRVPRDKEREIIRLLGEHKPRSTYRLSAQQECNDAKWYVPLQLSPGKYQMLILDDPDELIEQLRRSNEASNTTESAQPPKRGWWRRIADAIGVD